MKNNYPFTKYLAVFILLLTFSGLQSTVAQSKFSLMLGGFYNGNLLDDEVTGIGLLAGLEYMPKEEHFFSIELRTRYGYYKFDDGTSWKQNNDGSYEPPKRSEARLEYSLFSPQVSLVPKFYLHLEDWALFLENEFVGGLMSGRFKFMNDQKTKFTEPIFCYNVGVGADVKGKKCSFVGSITISTLNFRNKIKKHKPVGYEEWIPNQNAWVMINLICKVHL